MSTKRPFIKRRVRRGISMLELVIAGSMLALVMTSLSVVMRTSRQSWEAGDNDYAMLAQAHAVSRHFVRAAREAEAVESLSAGGRGITLRMRDGSTTSWQWQATGTDGMTGVVDVHPSAEKSAIALAYDIDNLNFVGYDADGVTVVIAPDDIYLIEVTVEVVLPRGDSARQRIRSKVWIRSTILAEQHRPPGPTVPGVFFKSLQI